MFGNVWLEIDNVYEDDNVHEDDNVYDDDNVYENYHMMIIVMMQVKNQSYSWRIFHQWDSEPIKSALLGKGHR